jgi:hypothetical protein
MPDVKPRPMAGAIRLSLMRADQKGTRSASVLAIVACILDPRIRSRPAPEGYSHARGGAPGVMAGHLAGGAQSTVLPPA